MKVFKLAKARLFPWKKTPLPAKERKVGLVLSGGGSRGAYQVGAMKALLPDLEISSKQISVVVGASLGAVNAVLLSRALRGGLEEAVSLLELLWRERNFRNTFSGTQTSSFVKALKIAFLRYSSPGPGASEISLFDPEPLRQRIDEFLQEQGDPLQLGYHPVVDAVGIMTTIEGATRKPLLLVRSVNKIPQERLRGAPFEVAYVDYFTAKHGLASAALPSVLPAVDLNIDNNTIRLVDGGICDNVPVDPALRLGAEELVIIDSSGRQWWQDHYGTRHDTRPNWEVISQENTFCYFSEQATLLRNIRPLGPLLKETAGRTTKDFIHALGPIWPIFKVLKHKMGEDLAYEVMSYVALHPDFIAALIDRGYQEAKEVLEATSLRKKAKENVGELG